MSFMLRVSITMLLFGLATLIYMYPAESRQYISDRYMKFHRYVHKTLPVPTILPVTLVSKSPEWIIQAFGVFVSVGGLMVLLNKRAAIIACAYILAGIGAILHMPYEGTAMVGQIRKLAFVFAVFFCTIILTTLKDEEVAEEKVKTQ